MPYTLPWYRFVARQTRFARENMVTPKPTPRHARTHVPARARAPTHARTPEDDHDRFVLGFFKGLLFQFFKLKKTFQTKNTKNELRVNIVLNNEEDPMHVTTNTCSCDCGVLPQFVVPRF